MTEFESAVMNELSQIKSATAGTTATLEALNTRLFEGPASVITTLQSDIQEIKDDRKSEAKWERVHNFLHYSLTPLVVGFHAVLRHFGVNV